MAEKKVLIISLSSNPGHTSHIIAYYKLFNELGFNTYLLVNASIKRLIPNDVEYIDSISKKNAKLFELVFIYSPSIHNLFAILKFRLFSKANILYVLHEPAEPYSLYKKLGYSHTYIIKKYLFDLLQRWVTYVVDAVILSSKKALSYYDSNKIYKNRRRFYLPLIYDDERENIEDTRRTSFSYIGTIAQDHSFSEFYEYVKYAINNKILPRLTFTIATKSVYEIGDEEKNLIKSGRLSIIQGKTMTNEEINKYYSEALIVWNAYSRSMQSGVLAKSFMFGSPAIVLRKNVMPEIEDYGAVVTIDDNMSYEQITTAIEQVVANQKCYSESCRKCFEELFYYKRSIHLMREIVANFSHL